MTASTTHNPQDEIPTRIEALAVLITRETEALLTQVSEGVTRQWEASPVPKPREDTGRTGSGDRPSDPTADTVADPRRLAVRETIIRSERVLRDAAIAVVATRKALARAVERFDGEGLT